MLMRLRQQVHVSWLLAWFSVALIVAIAVSTYTWHTVFISDWLACACAVFFMTSLIKSRAGVYLVLPVMLAGFAIGLWRGQAGLFETASYQFFVGQTVLLKAVVADDPVVKGGSAGLKLRDVEIGQTKLGGQIWASLSTGLSLKRDDRITLKGKLRSGFGSYSASMSFAKLTAVHREAHADPSREVRDTFSSGLKKTIPEPKAALALGYLTGQHNTVPDKLIKQMQITGLIHLVIAGGYNVTILVRLARRVFIRFAKRLAMTMAAGVLLGLMLISGFIAPMARTVVVAGLSLAAWYYGRWPHPLVLLPVAAAITALIDPSFVWGDVGWYMTFIAYGGLIVLGPMLKKWWWGTDSHGEVKQIIVDTVAVQIVTTPLMAYSFQQYSIYGLPANLLVLPLMSATMLASAAAGLAGAILPMAAARVISWPANTLLSYAQKITSWMAAAPGATTGSGISLRGLAVSYLCVVIFIWWLKRKVGYDFRGGEQDELSAGPLAEKN